MQYRRKKISYAMVALFLFSLFLLVTVVIAHAKRTNTESVDILFLGDSIIGQVQDDTSITVLLQNRLQREVFNGAFGGTTMSNTIKKTSYLKDGLSMVSLSKAIGYQDFGVQQNINVQENGTEYFGEIIDQLANIDYESCKILLIEHGVNDYNASIPIRNVEDQFDTYTYEGALRTTLKILQDRYPKLRIILVSPTYYWVRRIDSTGESWNSGYGYLDDYVDAQMEIAKEFDVELIDIYHDFYKHQTEEDWILYTTDGLHPNEMGRSMIADAIAAYLEANP